jgi:hypothetical protein
MIQFFSHLFIRIKVDRTLWNVNIHSKKITFTEADKSTCWVPGPVIEISSF